MTQLNQVNIEETSTNYTVTLAYHSNRKDKDENAEILVTEHYDGAITIETGRSYGRFEFNRSDPDRVIAIAQMIMAAAQMVKNHNEQKG